MKKLLILALSVLCFTGLAGCQTEEPLDPQEKLVIEDLVSIEIQDIDLAWSVEEPVTSRIVSVNYNLGYYDVQTEFTNLSGKELSLTDILACKIYFEEKGAPSYIKAESADRTELLEEYTIQPDETVLLHLYATYTPVETNVHANTEMILTIDEQEYTFALNSPNDFELEKTYAAFGETLTTSEDISIEIQESFIEKELFPANGNMGYQVEAGSQSFIILKLLVTNNSEIEKSVKELVGYRKSDGSFTHSAGTIVMESSDGNEFNRDGAINPGEQNIVYCLVAVSDSTIDEVTELRLDTADGTYYITR